MSDDPRLSELYRSKEAQEFLQCSKQHLNEHYKKKGIVKSYKIDSKTFMYLKIDVDRESKLNDQKDDAGKTAI